jgi:hypothetical protein
MMTETESVGTSIFSEISGSAFESEAGLLHFNHLFSCSEFACRLSGVVSRKDAGKPIRRMTGFAAHPAASF